MATTAAHRFSWLKSGLYWRTFFLLAILITISMATWVASFRMIERVPRAKQLAAQVVSIVTITRTALTHSAPDSRRELLFELASNEGIRVYPLENDDRVEALPATSLTPLLQTNVKAKLGADTRFAGKVNDITGFWVSFKIDEDAYWLMLDQGRIDRTSGLQWLGWAAITLLLALLGAIFISRLINQPLARLTEAARAIAKGQKITPLPEKGPTEIREANRSFNQMTDDLQRVEIDRAVILAGISHDLRTPISRMLLEVEMASLSPDARQGMASDLAQMDAIIGQFLDYAKPTDSASLATIDLTALLTDTAADAARLPNLRIQASIAAGMEVRANVIDLKRVFNNLIENARRYGKNEGSDLTCIDITCRAANNEVTIEFSDHGSGVPEAEIEHMLRPFTRLDAARSQANGAGLGLAIVERVIKRQGGTLRVYNQIDGGLAVEMVLPSATPSV